MCCERETVGVLAFSLTSPHDQTVHVASAIMLLTFDRLVVAAVIWFVEKYAFLNNIVYTYIADTACRSDELLERVFGPCHRSN